MNNLKANSNITVYDFNGAFFKINGEYEILKKLQTFFEFEHPNKYMVRQMSKKYGAWNGKVKLFKLNDKLFPIGFFHKLKKICKNLGIKINMSKKAYNLLYSNKQMDVDALKDTLYSYINKDFLQEIGGEIYEHQIKTAIKSIIEKRGVWDIHTRGGKSLIIYLVLRWMYEHFKVDDKIVLIVPFIHLAEQMFGDFSKYTDDTNFLQWISVFHSGNKDKDINKQLLVTTYQSFVKNKQVYSDVRSVIVDEVHSVGINSSDKNMKQLHKILDNLTNNEYRHGCTGTLPEEELARAIIESKFGRVLYKKDLLKSIDEGIVTDFTINTVIYDYMDENTIYENAYSDYQNYSANISCYNERPYIIPALIDNNIINKNAKVIETFNRLDSLKMFKKYQETNMKQYETYRFDGSVNVKRREKIRKIISETDKDKGVFCVSTLKVMNAGITIPNLDTIIFCDGSKKPETIKQAIGRAVGLDSNNPDKVATIVELVDFIKYKRKTGYSIKHMIDRIQMFKAKHYKQVFHYFVWIPSKKQFIKQDIPTKIQKILNKYI